MEQKLKNAYIAGFERLTAWSDLLDNINVFPVADADTGQNLVISLSPLKQFSCNNTNIIKDILLSARGNSGNIAASFFGQFLKADSIDMLAESCKIARNKAWKSIAKPKIGTMLSFFDSLSNAFNFLNQSYNHNTIQKAIDLLIESVKNTQNQIDVLKKSNVVDSGALAMFIFFECFLLTLIDKQDKLVNICKIFNINRKYSKVSNNDSDKICVSAVIDNISKNENDFSKFGSSIVKTHENNLLKLHIHINDKKELKDSLAKQGKIIDWKEEPINEITKQPNHNNNIHIITDAAGSISLKTAQENNISLLSSYINIDKQTYKEIYFDKLKLYEILKTKQKVTTSSASQFEKYQSYQSISEQYKNVIYLCVGSFYTQNFQTATSWKKQFDLNDKFTIIDTGTASGKLAITVLETAQFAKTTNDLKLIKKFIDSALANSHEYIFLDKLSYLAKSGRLSKTSAFIGDTITIKPVVTPEKTGAKKITSLFSKKQQLKFALNRLKDNFSKNTEFTILLEYTDNKSWIKETVQETIKKNFPLASIILEPLSLTTGVHTGPKAWGITFLKHSDEFKY